MSPLNFSISLGTKVSAGIIVLLCNLCWGQQELVSVSDEISESFKRITTDIKVQASLKRILEIEPNTIREQFRITEIPAPPFKEQERAAYYLNQMRSRGLEDAYIDEEGNVIGIRKGTGEGPSFLISAHLDTVFPEGVDTPLNFEVDAIMRRASGMTHEA